MTVNLDAEDRTWITHVNGFQAILRQQPNTPHGPFAQLVAALHIVDRRHAPDILPVIPRAVHPSVLTLRLKGLVSPAACLLSPETSKPRQIEVVKLRRDLKNLYADMRLINPDMIIHALTIVAANLLIVVGTYLDSSFSATKLYSKLTCAISESVNGIHETCMSVVARAEVPIVHAVKMTWSLYIASKARGIKADVKRNLQQLLWRVGEVGRVPLAFRLVSTYHITAFGYADRCR
jgi:hypothetical protein